MTRVNSAQVKSEGTKQGAAALPSRIVANFALAVVALARPPRAKLPAPSRRAVAAVLLLTCMAIIASMFLLDRTASDWARHLPGWFIEAFERITDFGLSGWFLYPLGVILLGLAAVASPASPRLAQGVFAALGARFGFLFVAIFVVAMLVYRPEELRQPMLEAITHPVVHYDNQKIEQMQALVKTSEGLTFVVVFGLFLLFLIFVVGSSIGGALYAAWLRKRMTL